jgi:hypothetical protein
MIVGNWRGTPCSESDKIVSEMSISRPFETDRTRRHRQGELSKFNEGEISNIEEFGCEVLSVALSEPSPPGFLTP